MTMMIVYLHIKILVCSIGKWLGRIVHCVVAKVPEAGEANWQNGDRYLRN